jgi:PAS domain S-box-containing protein
MRQSLQTAANDQSIRAKEEEQRNWGTAGLAKFAEILRHDNGNPEALAYNIVSNMVKYLDANQGGLSVLNDDNDNDKYLELRACYAFDRKKFLEKRINIGEGLVGACYIEGENIYLTDIPDEYINITSGLGDANPKAVMICPLKLNDEIYGVIELASFREFEPYQCEFIQKVSESIASTIATVRVNVRTSLLLEQTKLQAEEMANQEEELRQNMEEMQATQEEMFHKNEEAERAHNDLTKIMSENKYQLSKLSIVMQASNIGLWDMQVVKGDPVNQNNTFVWSDEFRNMLGYSNEIDFPNVLSSWSDKLHPDDKDGTLDAFARHLLDRTGKTPYDLEYRLLKKDGEYSYYHAFGATIRDEEGYALRVAGAIQDITKEKKNAIEMQKMQDAIEKEKFEMQAMINSIDSTFIRVTYDVDMNIMDLNDHSVKLYGTSREKLLGTKITAMMSPEEVEDFTKNWNEMLKGEIIRGEGDRLTVNGILRVWYMYSPIKDVSGKICKVMMIGQVIDKK